MEALALGKPCTYKDLEKNYPTHSIMTSESESDEVLEEEQVEPESESQSEPKPESQENTEEPDLKEEVYV
jgi:hypothetical protein